MEREISLPFVAPATAPAPVPRPADLGESRGLRGRVAALLEQRADAIAACWENPGDAVALVRVFVAWLEADGSSDDAVARGSALGSSAFEAGLTLQRLLRALDRLEMACLDVVADSMVESEGSMDRIAGVRICRQLRQVSAAVAIAAVEAHGEAAGRVLQERFRRLRHDLRNPLGTIQNALSLLADETLPEVTRRGPLFRAMIERNTAMLDRMIVSRLSDDEAQVLPALAPSPAGERSPGPFLIGEPRDELARPCERDDGQAHVL